MITKQVIASEQVTFSGLSSHIAVSSGDSQGTFNVMVVSVEPGRGGPPHISEVEDKYFHVLDGLFEFTADGERYCLSKDDSLTVARGTVHSFTNIACTPSRFLLVSGPAGHAEFFRDMARLPVPHDRQQVEDVCRKHNQTILSDR